MSDEPNLQDWVSHPFQLTVHPAEAIPNCPYCAKGVKDDPGWAATVKRLLASIARRPPEPPTSGDAWAV